MSDLKPCPFCGGEASMIDDSSHSTAFSVGCYNGNCAMEPYTWDVSEAKAIANWNRRALPAVSFEPEPRPKPFDCQCGAVGPCEAPFCFSPTTHTE